MSKESFKRPTTEVFRKDSEKNLLGKGKDWCNPKNLPEIRKTEELLRKEEVEIKYDSGQYLVNNLWLLLGKTSLDDKARTLMHHEIRAAWDSAINEAQNGDGEDSHGFKEKKVYNLYWLSSRFKLSEKCKKLQLKDGEIQFLDKDGGVILSFSVDLKSSARKIAESKEMVEACKDERKEKGKKVAEEVVEVEKLAEVPAPKGVARPVETVESGRAERRPSEDEKLFEAVRPIEPAELVSEVAPVGPAKLVSEVGPIGPVELVSEVGPINDPVEDAVWLLKDEIRDFSNSAIELAKSQKTLRPAETAEAGRSERRAEESAKPETRSAETAGLARGRRSKEDVGPVEVVKPFEAVKSIDVPAPKGTVRSAETAESALPGRPIETVGPVEPVEPKPVVSAEELRKMAIYTTIKESHEMQQLSGQPSWWPKNAHVTIDDGPRLANNSLPRILDALDKYGIKATFFFVGAQLDFERKRNPDLLRSTLWRLINAGHQIGCHAYNHKYTFNTKEKVLEQIDKFQVALDQSLFTGKELADGKTYKVTVGRMPGGTGTHKASTIEAFKERGMEPPKYWHIETKPWERNVQKRSGKYADALRQLDEKNTPHIMLLHEYPHTGADLDKMLVAFVPGKDREHMLAKGEGRGAAPK